MRIQKNTVQEKFLRYAGLDTQSDSASAASPSTAKQVALARLLAGELQAMGAINVELDGNGYVTATIPATAAMPAPVIGLIAHMDTSPDASGANVQPQVIENYDGSDIVLNPAENIVLRVSDFPELQQYTGQTMITTDGTTLLGADDKAGIAAIMTAAEYLLAHDEIKHGTVRIAFTPDEEIGRGAERFDVARFAADYAYTVDGGEVGELEYENFNAAEVVITIAGRGIHPGYAKGKMVNALNVAHEFHTALPAAERPETTDGTDGFFHLTGLEGTVEKARLHYIIRDFDKAGFERRKKLVEQIAGTLNKQYASNVVRLQVRDQYYNMADCVRPHFYIIERATEAMRKAGIEPIVKPARGGTDGARLSFMGLPCPNLFTGGHNPHGIYEFVTVESMQKTAEVILNLVTL